FGSETARPIFSSLKLPTGPCHPPEVGETIQPT
ncbi:MAG: hypothetical protein ACI9DF_004585, partial [Verrucomicrobiales bacterium]